jgi:LacI family transcriptional regulator
VFSNIEGETELAVAGVDALIEQRVAGFVFLAQIQHTPELVRSLRHSDVPMVAIGLRQDWTDSVGPNDREGGRLATQHLLDLGHRRIAYIRTAVTERSGDRARYAGYCAAMRKAGLEPAPAMRFEVSNASLRTRSTVAPLSSALRGRTAPTAVFVWNDFGAIGLIEACEQAGISVPDDLSVVGFDDIDMAALGRISLTSVAQPLDFQAEKAVDILLGRIHGGGPAEPQHLSVPVELRVRGSSGPPRSSRRVAVRG